MMSYLKMNCKSGSHEICDWGLPGRHLHSPINCNRQIWGCRTDNLITHQWMRLYSTRQALPVLLRLCVMRSSALLLPWLLDQYCPFSVCYFFFPLSTFIISCSSYHIISPVGIPHPMPPHNLILLSSTSLSSQSPALLISWISNSCSLPDFLIYFCIILFLLHNWFGQILLSPIDRIFSWNWNGCRSPWETLVWLCWELRPSQIQCHPAHGGILELLKTIDIVEPPTVNYYYQCVSWMLWERLGE